MRRSNQNDDVDQDETQRQNVVRDNEPSRRNGEEWGSSSGRNSDQIPRVGESISERGARYEH